LLPGCERLKAGGVELDESRVSDALDDDLVGAICLAECWRGESDNRYEENEYETQWLQRWPPGRLIRIGPNSAGYHKRACVTLDAGRSQSFLLEGF
jgi:hypothetical protein